VDSARGANTPCTMQKTLYEKPTIEILLAESIIRVDDVENLKQFRAGKESRRRTAGLPSFDRKYQACVIGCRLFLLEFDPVPSHWIGFTVSGQFNPVLRISEMRVRSYCPFLGSDGYGGR
jgi:hypothetical protein